MSDTQWTYPEWNHKIIAALDPRDGCYVISRNDTGRVLFQGNHADAIRVLENNRRIQNPVRLDII